VSRGAVKSPPVLDLLRKAASIWPPFGSEELRNGDGAALCPFFTAVKESDELTGSGAGGDSRLSRYTEVLLRRC
jgi:hypothetical protein